MHSNKVEALTNADSGWKNNPAFILLIDEELEGELRVTVVATGLGREKFAEQDAPVVVANNPLSNPMDYSDLDTPAITRKNNPQKAVVGSDMDYLDIPAFLRKQNN